MHNPSGHFFNFGQGSTYTHMQTDTHTYTDRQTEVTEEFERPVVRNVYQEQRRLRVATGGKTNV